MDNTRIEGTSSTGDNAPAAQPTGVAHSEPMKVIPLVGGCYLVRFISPSPGQPLKDPMSLFSAWVKEKGFKGGVIDGLGSATNLTLATWDAEQKGYTTLKFDAPSYEATGINGNVAFDNGDLTKVSIHMHLVIGDKDKLAHAGHVVGAFDVPAVLELRFMPSDELMVRAVAGGTGGPALDPC